MTWFSKRATIGASRDGLHRSGRRRALPQVEAMEGRMLLTTLNDLPRPFIDEWHTAQSHGIVLGPPTSGVFNVRDGGQGIHFERGSIYSSAFGAHEVHGAIRDAWAALGWESGPLGYPTSDEVDGGDGYRASHFQG